MRNTKVIGVFYLHKDPQWRWCLAQKYIEIATRLNRTSNLKVRGRKFFAHQFLLWSCERVEWWRSWQRRDLLIGDDDAAAKANINSLHVDNNMHVDAELIVGT